MAEKLCSVGVDVGTTTTQLIVSELVAENRASAFTVPQMEITGRKILYESQIHFTPLLSAELVDGEGIRRIVAEEYARAGLRREDVDTGAIIITGETSRKENAAAVLAAISDFAGDFVVATAGPDLESVLAAKGAGAVAYSAQTGQTVLHMDIGGGTSNLALIEQGRVVATGCFNVGGRLIKLDDQASVTYLSPVLEGAVDFSVGDVITKAQAQALAKKLAQTLECAAGLRAPDSLCRKLITPPTHPPAVPAGTVISFSGGVADCIRQEQDWLCYGDLGPLLGQAIRESALCRGQYLLGEQTIRATVIGAGCHSTQLSGSTVCCSGVRLPLKNLPVAVITAEEQEADTPALSRLLRSRLAELEQWGVLYLPGWNAPSYARVAALADAIAAAVEDRPCYIALRADMAKALGVALSLRLPEGTPCLCVDSVTVPRQSYLDVLGSVGSAIALVVKTLIFSH